MLSTIELAAMQADQLALMPAICTITRRTAGAPDGSGGTLPDTDAVVATVACRIAPVGEPRDATLAERQAVIGQYTISLPIGTDVRAADKLTSGTRTWEVIGAASVHSYQTAVRVLASEVT